MRFTCEKNMLMTGLNITGRTVAQKSTLSVIEGILCRAGADLSLTGYNMETAITYSIEAEVSEAGECVLPARLFGDIIRRLPEGPVTVTVDNNFKVSIRSGYASFNISAESAEDYPELPDVDSGRSISIPQSALKDLISGTIFAVSENTGRPIHTGVKFEIEDTAISAIAVDGFRVAIRQEKIDFEGVIRFIVPARAMSEVLRLITTDADIKITMSKRHIIFTVDGFMIISRLLDGDFFSYERILTDEVNTTLSVDTRLLIDMIERVSTVIVDKERRKTPICCNISDGVFKATCTTDVGSATDELPVDMEGKDINIGFNFRYLLEALRASESDKLVLQLNESDKPLFMRPIDGDSFLYIVLPVRLK